MKPFSEAFDQSKFACYPKLDKNEQPWNATDNYLYTQIVESGKLSDRSSVAILNDENGVLTYLMRKYQPLVTADSYFSKMSVIKNFRANYEDEDQFEYMDSVSFVDDSLPRFDVVLLKIPKSTKYFEEQLAILSQVTDEQTTFLVSGMVKHISKTSKEMLEKMIGETLVHRVFKKAILFSCTPRTESVNYNPIQKFTLPNLGEFQTYSNTFSNGRLDKGTEVLLKHLPKDLSGRVIDLGCGYGPISRFISDNCESVNELCAVDVSRMAAMSTKENVPKAKVFWGDGVMRFDDESFDAVVSNPPFHLDNKFSVAMGLRLITQVKMKLKPRGKFIMVANSGLNYGPYLERYFKKVRVISNDRRYTVFEAVK